MKSKKYKHFLDIYLNGINKKRGQIVFKIKKRELFLEVLFLIERKIDVEIQIFLEIIKIDQNYSNFICIYLNAYLSPIFSKLM
jgi:hypothetical protein